MRLDIGWFRLAPAVWRPIWPPNGRDSFLGVDPNEFYPSFIFVIQYKDSYLVDP
jgi:hypothetical protein